MGGSWFTCAPLGGRMTAKQELGREYHFPHVACCPCMDTYDLYRDDSYDWDKWQQRKSWSRYIPSLITCFQVGAWYWPPVLLVVGIACMLGVYKEKAEPRGAPSLTDHNYTVPYVMTSTALALILTFRTNSAYDRWWEARKILGGLLGLSRDVVRIAMSVSRPDCQHLIAMVGRWTIAMPYVLREHVTEFVDVPLPLQRILRPRELELLTNARHRPSVVCQVLSDAAVTLCSADVKFTHLSARISQYHDFVAAAERLLRQPIPTAYTRHTSRFIMTWIIFLPFALWQTCQWLTPFISGAVAFVLVGIENIGIQIEQPFSVLPLDTFAAIIEADVVEMLQMRAQSEQLVEDAAADFAAADGLPTPKSVDKSPSRKSVDIGEMVWPTGFGPTSIPQHMTIIPEDEVHMDATEVQQSQDSRVFMMEPTTGRLALNGSFSKAGAAHGTAGSFTNASARRPPQPQRMDSGRQDGDAAAQGSPPPSGGQAAADGPPRGLPEGAEGEAGDRPRLGLPHGSRRSHSGRAAGEAAAGGGGGAPLGRSWSRRLSGMFGGDGGTGDGGGGDGGGGDGEPRSSHAMDDIALDMDQLQRVLSRKGF